MYNITLIPGDGIGHEITAAVQKVIAAANVKVQWDIVKAGAEAYETTGKFIPDELLDSISKNKIAFKGPITTPIGTGFRSINVSLRQTYKTYANVRPAKSLQGINTPFKNVDLVIIRENSEGLYSGIEHKVTEGVTESIKVITEKASLRIGEYAFEYAKKHNRKKVTAVHKANIMKISDGLFLDCIRKVANKYPDIEYDEVIVDNMCMQLVMYPNNYDVLVCPNLYGDILSDLAAGLVGGLGLVPSANMGEDIAIFEAVHGSAPDIAGKNIANPTACILSATMMLDYIGEKGAASRIRQAVECLIKEGEYTTPDIGGTATTDELTKALCAMVGS